MYKFIITFIILINSFVPLRAQQTFYYDVRLSRDLFDMSRQETEKRMLNYYEGTPYLNDQFTEGVVYTNSKTKYVDIPMRYDIYNDVIEFKNETDNILTLSNPEIVEKIEFGEYKLIYCTYSFSNKNVLGFFNEIIDGKAKLLCRYRVEFKQASEAKPFKNPEPAQFAGKSNKYYIQLGENEAKPVDNKNKLLSVLEDKKIELKAYIKENNLKVHDLEALKKIVSYYNTL